MVNFLLAKFNLARNEKYFGLAYQKFLQEKMIDDTQVSVVLQKANESALAKLSEYTENHDLKRLLHSCEMLNPAKMRANQLKFEKFINGFTLDAKLNLIQLQNEQAF